jgi:hypothetical protein
VSLRLAVGVLALALLHVLLESLIGWSNGRTAGAGAALVGYRLRDQIEVQQFYTCQVVIGFGRRIQHVSWSSSLGWC